MRTSWDETESGVPGSEGFERYSFLSELWRAVLVAYVIYLVAHG